MSLRDELSALGIRTGDLVMVHASLRKLGLARSQGIEQGATLLLDALDEVAKETSKTIPQVALNWLLQRPTVSTVIMGARNEEQLRQNLASAGWNLTAAQVAKLDAASDVTPVYPYWHQLQFTERNPPPIPVK